MLNTPHPTGTSLHDPTGPHHEQRAQLNHVHGEHAACGVGNDRPSHTAMGGVNSMALSATLHCLTGCAVGEILGLMVGTAIGLSTGWTIVLAVSLAFIFGYALSTLPLVKAGLDISTALVVVFAADTLSIATMEAVDNAVMALIPGAMDAGLVNAMFWASMMIALTAAFFAAYPVNRYLLARGKGHALTHAYHGAPAATGARRYIPTLATPTLIAAIGAFMVGGLVVSLAADLGDRQGDERQGGGDSHALHLVQP